MSFQRDELVRLRSRAERGVGLASHVLPYEGAAETLQADVRPSAIEYFKEHDITWWTSPYDKRTKDTEARPTDLIPTEVPAAWRDWRRWLTERYDT
jgi:hypothetical protein